MKRFLVTLFILTISLEVLSAQDYQVYTVRGDVAFKEGEKLVKVAPKMVLGAKTVLIIPAESRLVLLCETSKELFTIKVKATGTIENLLKKQGNTTQQLTESYLAFIKQKITDTGNSKEKNYKQSAGTSYRETDSLLLKTLVPQNPIDTTKKDKGLSSKDKKRIK